MTVTIDGKANDGSKYDQTATAQASVQAEPVPTPQAIPRDNVRRDVENVIGTDTADHLTGDSGPNALTGRNGKDVLDGAGGDDILAAGAGDDILTGGAGIDVFGCGVGNDTVTDNASGEQHTACEHVQIVHTLPTG